MTNKKVNLGLILLSIFLVLTIAANTLLSRYAGVITQAVSGSEMPTELSEELFDEGYDVCVSLAREGAVLLKNENNALPLDKNEKITILGYSSYAYFTSGTGSAGGRDDGNTVSMKDAFSGVGLAVNETGWATLSAMTGNAEHQADAVIRELTGDSYRRYFTDEVIADYKTAIVTIGRNGGEGVTLSREYLQLNQNEKDLLAFCAEKFEKTIVLLNTSNVMEIGFVDKSEYNIDACLWIGGPGENGMIGIADILVGNINPSGHTVDTWAYDLRTAPAYYNEGDNKYENYTRFGYYQYEEGIYVGYRWYETADAQGYFDSYECLQTLGITGYDNIVQYPFGYGGSYTTFAQTITDSHIDLSAHAMDNFVEIQVTNTGTVAGKDVVQLYMTAPYNTDGNCGIHDGFVRVPLEKSDVVLIGFVKTELIQPGESCTVKVYFNTDDLASFDNFGYGCYVLEKGTYEFIAGEDCHNAFDKIKEELAETIVYSDEKEGARYSDKKTAVNVLNEVTAGDGVFSANLAQAYLSRNNFAVGFDKIISDSQVTSKAPESIVAALTVGGRQTESLHYQYYEDGTLTEGEVTYYFSGALADAYETTNWYGYESNDEKYRVTYGKSYAEQGVDPVDFKDLYGAAYDDPRWEYVLNCITLEELVSFNVNQMWYTPAIESIGKPMNICKDGESEVGGGGYQGLTNFPTEVVSASTWDTDLIYDMGVAYGHQGAYYGVFGAYAPGMNIHRTPMGGRNHEYYSEDGFISGKMAAAEVAGMQNGGVMVYCKHAVANDAETNRAGAITWLSEQALREIYAVPFELAVKEGGALGIMASMNRLGVTCNHPAFYRTILREEWGFLGYTLKDGALDGVSYSTSNCCLYGGVDGMLGGNSVTETDASDGDGGATGTLYGIYLLREAAHHGLYQYVNCDAPISETKTNTLWYIAWAALDVVLIGSMIAVYCLLVHKNLIVMIRNKAQSAKDE